MIANLAFVTSNIQKLREARRITGVDLRHAKAEIPEIQSHSCVDVARCKALSALAITHDDVLVEDCGLELIALGRFPGPLIKFWNELGGYESICRALDGFSDRSAVMTCAATIATKDGRVYEHESRLHGKISMTPRGGEGFGHDCIFCPDGFQNQTIAQMPSALKDRISPRAIALREVISAAMRQER